jgi:hypothetical protein
MHEQQRSKCESAIGRDFYRPLGSAQRSVEHFLVVRPRRHSEPDLIQVAYAEQGPGIGILGNRTS